MNKGNIRKQFKKRPKLGMVVFLTEKSHFEIRIFIRDRYNMFNILSPKISIYKIASIVFGMNKKWLERAEKVHP